MSDDIAIKVDNVSKKYCKSLKKSMFYGVSDISRNTIRLGSRSYKLRPREFWALDDISFELKKGETLGIIGPNGSGKTTLLKLLNGIFWPDKGKITVKGRVGALISVGAGFHPLLSGKENVYINGAILGMGKREIDKKFDSIIEFADIGDFLDVPVKHYSSGMFVRLGFAVAVHCEPDILIVDEILAVGDTNFQNKCLSKIADIRNKSAVVLVSHNLNTIQLICERCLLLKKGKTTALGNTSEVLKIYSEHSFSTEHGKYKSENLDIEILNGDHPETNTLIINSESAFKFALKQLVVERGVLIAFSFVNMTNKYSYRLEISDYLHLTDNIDSLTFTVTFDNFYLPPGKYTIRLAVSDGDFLRRIFHVDRTILFDVIETESQKFLNPIIS